MTPPDDAEIPPTTPPMIRTIAMPADANGNGDIFGGWLMGLMDMGGANLAARIAQGRLATVAVDAMSFLRPVKIGDEVSVYADLIAVGRTSIKVNVEAWRRSRDSGERRVTRAVFTFVAIDDHGQKRIIPPRSPDLGPLTRPPITAAPHPPATSPPHPPR